MISNHKIIGIISLILILFISINFVSATDDLNSSELISINDTVQETSYSNNYNSLEKNDINLEANQDSKYVYVSNKGDSSSDGKDISNPTTLKKSFKYVEDEGSIILLGNQENTVYSITEDINTNDLNTNVKSFKIKANEGNQITLKIYSFCNMRFNSKINIEIDNIIFTREYSSDWPMIENKANLTLNNCTFYGNNGTGSFGLINTTNNISLNNCNFYNNSAKKNGGILTVENSYINIENCVFENNHAQNGGVISSTNSIINVQNSTFDSNSADIGGVFFIIDKSIVYTDNSIFNNNSARYEGGVIDSYYSASVFNTSVFTNNNAQYGGVTCSVHNVYTLIYNSLLEDNFAYDTGNDVYAYRDNLTIHNSAILNKNSGKSIYCFNVSYDLNNNWWGSNNPKFNLLTNDILPESWRLMTLTNDDTKIQVSLNSLSNSKTTNDEIYKRIVYFENANDILEFTNTTITNSISNSYKGNLDNVIIKIDNQTMKISDKITPYLYISDITAKINDNVTITVNCNPDISDNLNLKVNDYVLTNIKPVNGVATYNYVFDSSYNTGLYNLTVSITNHTKYSDTITTGSLILKDNHNNSNILISGSQKEDPYNQTYTINRITRYDANNFTQFQTSIKNQGDSGSCWAFSTLSALEAAYLKAYGIEYNFSENNMKNILKRYSTIGDVTSYPNTGNSELEPIAYLIGWYGPINEEDDPYDDYSIISPRLNNTLKVEDVYFIYRSTATGKDNNALKEAILKYGAVSSSIFSSYSGFSGKSVYTNEYIGADHAISIVGWDNYYNSFYGSSKPSGSGAYIIKNSWGESTGDNGYQYVSYYDTSLAGVGINSILYGFSYAFPVKIYENYTNIYQHDTVAAEIQTLSPAAWVRNVYTAERDESIAGVGTYIYENCDYEAYIYVNDKLAYTQTGSIDQAGYRIIKLNQYVAVYEGDVFKVDLKLKAQTGSYTAYTYQNTREYKSTSKPNQSFISTDGINWKDLYYDSDYPGSVACLKVYTKETPTINSTITNNGKYEITTTVKDVKTNGKLSYKIDDEYYTDDNGNIIYIDVTENKDYTISIPTKSIKKYAFNITISLETNDYTITENYTMISPVKVNIKTDNITTYIYEGQNIIATLDIEDNIYGITINEGTVLLLTNTDRIVERCQVVNGKVNFTLNLGFGNYTYKLSYEGPNTYECEEVSFNITVLKYPTNIEIIKIENNEYNENATITGRIYSINEKAMPNTSVRVNIDGKIYNIRSNSKGEFIVNHFINKTGEIPITITFYTNTTHLAANIEDTFTANKQSTIISINPITEHYIGETVEISGKLTDKNNNVLTDKTVSLYKNGELITNINTDSNGDYTYTYTVLNADINNITVKFEGDDLLASSENSTIYSTLEKMIKTTSINVDVNNDTLRVNDELEISAVLIDQDSNPLQNTPVILNINNDKINLKTDDLGKITYNYLLKTDGIITVKVSYAGDDDYYPSESTQKTITILPEFIDTTISLNELKNIKYNTTVTITGVLTDINGNKLNNENVLLTIDGNQEKLLTINGLFEYNISFKEIGEKTITVKYEGNTNYNPSDAELSIVVDKQNTILTLDEISPVRYNDEITITGTLTNENNESLTNEYVDLKINDEPFRLKVSSGLFQYKYTVIDTKIQNIVASYTGNNYYNPNSSNISVIINKRNTKLIVEPITPIKFSDNFNIIGSLTDEDNNLLSDETINIKIGEKSINITTDNGKFTYTSLAEECGEKLISIKYLGNNNYNPSDTTTTVTITKQNTQISVNTPSPIRYQDNTTITGKLTNENNQVITDTEVIINIDNTETTIKTDNKGIFTYIYQSKDTGNKTIKINYEGNENYNPTNTTTTLEINRQNTTITINTTTAQYKDNITIKGTFVNEKNNPLINSNLELTINGVKYSVKTNNKGIFNYSFIANDVGINNITVKYAGNAKYNPTITITTVNVTPKNTEIIIDKISPSKYNDIITITGKFINKDGTALINSNLKVSINGQNNSTKTNNKGIFTYTYKTTTTGTNNITISYGGNAKYTTTSTTTTFLVNKKDTKLTIDTIDTSKYNDLIVITGKFTNEDNTPLIKSSLTLTINEKTYSVKTDNEGVYNYSFKATVVGTNNITISYNGNAKYNKASQSTTFTVVKKDTIISIDKIENACYNDNITITGKFTNADGANLISSKLTIIVNGKEHTVTTNNNGIFTLVYNAKDLGTNNITVSYGGNAKYNKASATTTFELNKKDTKITINKIASVTKGSNVTVTGKFTDINGINLINSKVTVYINGNANVVKTNSNGVYEYTFTTKITGINNITVEYKGNSKYGATTTNSSFTVKN